MRLVLFALVLVLGGCEASFGSRLVARLRECGHLTEGTVGTSALSVFYVPDRCYEDCLARASCDDLMHSICRDDLSLVLACDEACAHRCDDGALIGLERVCNRFPDCAGGEDETGCPGRPRVPCADDPTRSGVACDGTWDCPDGSDERCDFRCGDGEGVSAWQLCDGSAQCADASDERDCHHVSCGTGDDLVRRLDQPSPRCDGWPECADGSDERDCARLDVTCS